MPGPNSSDDRNPVERLAEEFLERRRRGEHPPLSEFVQRFPELEGEIRDLFPALALMERLKPDDDDVTGAQGVSPERAMTAVPDAPLGLPR